MAPNLRQLWRNIILVILALSFVSLLFSFFLEGGNTNVEQLTMNQVVERVNGGAVQKIAVRGNELVIELVGGGKATAQKEREVGLTETLVNYGVKPEALARVALSVEDEGGMSYWLGILIPTILPIILIVILFSWMLRSARAGANQAFSFGKATIRLVAPSKDRITFKDVAGLKEAKEEMEEVVDFLKNPKKFLAMGARIPRGVLLMGHPGTGKTLLARAVAGESNVPFFHLSASEFVEMFVGVGASRVRDLFQNAKKAAPSIVFIDEIDAVGRERGTGMGGGHDEREQTLNQILVEMDGFERETNVIVMAASVTGDTPVLVERDGGATLLPISNVIDEYYANERDEGEKSSPDLTVLGFERKQGAGGMKNALLFDRPAFKKVRSVFRHRVQEIYEIHYNGGMIRTTGNHSVFVRTQRGLAAKPVCELRSGEILADLPYVAGRTQKTRRELRTYRGDLNFALDLPVWQPLFAGRDETERAYAHAVAHRGEESQTTLGATLGFSQTTIGKWQRGVCGPRTLSRNYFQHRDVLPETVRVTPDLMRLMGYYAAEGYARTEVDFCFNEKERSNVEDVRALMHAAFGVAASRERHITPHAVNLVYHSKPLAEFFAHHCGHGAHSKHVPSFLFTAPKEYFIEFLRGYAAGDGSVDTCGRLSLTSMSKQLLLELNWLARMHGHKSFLGSFRTKEGRVIKGGKPLASSVAWRLGFGKTQNPLDPRPGKASIKRAIVQKVVRVPFDAFVYDFCGCENEAFFGGNSPLLLHNTNRADILDSALLRPGRFDRRVVLDMPDIQDREAILKIHAKEKPLAKDVNLNQIAVRTPGFSGADLANLMNEAAILAARQNKKEIVQLDVLNSIEKVLLGPARHSRVITPHEKQVTAYHEAGHALVAASLADADPVHKVSIVSRGMAGGYTIKLPLEERRLRTKKQFLTDLAVSFGGYVAELLTFGDITTGSSSDISQATDLAHRLVTQYGMNETLGPRSFGKQNDLIFLGREIGTQKDYSEEVGAKIDAEVNRLIINAVALAKKILTRHKRALKSIAEHLIEKETIEYEEFNALMKTAKLKPMTIS